MARVRFGDRLGNLTTAFRRWLVGLVRESVPTGYGRGFPLTDPQSSLAFADIGRPLAYILSIGAVLGLGVVLQISHQQADVASVAMLDLLLIMLSAVIFGKGPAVATAFSGFLSIAWLFAPPLQSFRVDNPQEWLLMLTFLATGLVTGQLAGALRQKAREAVIRERQAVIFAEVMRELAEHDLPEALTSLTHRLKADLDLSALRVSLGQSHLSTGVVALGERAALEYAEHPDPQGEISDAHESGSTMKEPDIVQTALLSWLPHLTPRDDNELPWQHRQYAVTVQGQTVGALTAVRTGKSAPFSVADNRLLAAVAVQIGLVCERELLRREGTENEILRRSDDLKTALLHAVSHDLRTPLASIIAASASLLEEDVVYTLQERLELAQTVYLGAERLRQLVDNLLDLSRLEAGMLEPQKEWYDLRLLVDDVVGRLRPITARHEIMVQVPDDLPPVPMDYVRIGQVLTNLIENAAKHTPAGTHVAITAACEGGEVRLAVEDDGPGISAQALEQVFEPFFRVHGNDGPPQGAGLGLAVARGLVEAHGGRIWGEASPTGGARFVVALPIYTPGACEDTNDGFGRVA